MRYPVIALLLFLSLTTVLSQTQFATLDSYAAADTSSWYTIAAGNQELAFEFNDSVNVSITVQYKYGGSTIVNSYTAADSTNSVVAAGCFRGYVLRRGATDNIPGATKIRICVNKPAALTAAKNGLTSTYNGWIVRN